MICYNKTHDKVYVEQMLEMLEQMLDNKLVLSIVHYDYSASE